MVKVISFFVICFYLMAFNFYAYPFYKKPSSKLEYVENLYILETALTNKESLKEHLQKYSTNAQELKTGDTALHVLSNKMAGIHHVLISSAQVPGELSSVRISHPYLETEYNEKKEMVEYLILQDASPYIRNKKGEKAIESEGFDLYVNQVLETYSSDPDKKIYKVYLAGPEVFLPFYEKVSRFLKTQVSLFNQYHLQNSDYHIEGLLPSDESGFNSYREYFKAGTQIYDKNRALMHSSHAIIANMIRHNGSSMDVGTAYEIGEMVQAQKTVVGYYDEKIYHLQYESHFNQTKLYPSSGEDLISNERALSFRDLEVPDNLMVVMATLSSTEEIQFPTSSWEALFVLKSKLDSKKE